MSPRAAQIIVAVDPGLPGMSRICDPLEGVAVLPTAAALREQLRQVDPSLSGVVIPCTKATLVVPAHLMRAGRVAVFVDARAQLSETSQAVLRAMFAVVDAVLVADAPSEQAAVRWGGDPERVVRIEDLAASWFARRPRKPLTRALPEMGVSLGLDFATKSGLMRLIERASPYRGVNVVNYHRVLPQAECVRYNRPQMALPESVFAAQLEAMGSRRGFVAVDDLQEQACRGKVAVTFDDGYEDNLRVAMPWLKQHHVPACIYLATDFIGQDEALWWDRLGSALIAWWEAGARPDLPDVLHDVGALAQANELSDARQLVTDYCSKLNAGTEAEQSAAVAAAEALMPDRQAPRTMLDWDEIRRMAAAGVRFGSHTKTHIPLDTLERKAALDELLGSQEALEAAVPEGALTSTALPRGRRGPLEPSDLERFSTVMTTDAGVHEPDAGQPYVKRRDGKMLTLGGRHHPGKLRLELSGWLDPVRRFLRR